MSQKSLLELLQIQYPDSSKSTLRKWIKFGRVVVDGQVMKKDINQVQDESSFELRKKKNNTYPFPILHEDEDIIVVHKPYKLLSVASLDPSEKSVHGYLKHHLKPLNIYPVHRLDRDVSGPLIFAKSKRAYEVLKEAFYNHEVHREYKAVVHGRLHEERGIWESYLEQKKNYEVKASDDQGKHAITHYRVVDANDKVSLLSLTLETGRKNQLRVHTQVSGHPILGDPKYGIQDGVRNLCLFAHKLYFQHPISQKKMFFEIKPPPFFARVLSRYQLKFS